MASGVLQNVYQPVARMQEKAAQLRAELDAMTTGSALGSLNEHPSAAVQQKSSMRERLHVRISEPGNAGPEPHTHVSTPGQPRFKPNRQFAHTSAEDTVGAAALEPPPTGSASSTDGKTSQRPISARPAPAHRVSSTSATGTLRRSSSFSRGIQDGTSSPSGSSSTAPPAATLSSALSRSMRTVSNGGVDLRSRGSSPLKMSLALQEHNQQLVAQLGHAEQELVAAEHRYVDLEADLERRQESYMRREEQHLARIKELEAQLTHARGERSSGPMGDVFGKASQSIKELHGQVVNEIEKLLEKQAVVIKHEDQTTLRRFKNKLAEAEAQVVSERDAQGRTHKEWMERTQGLRAELEMVQEVAAKLDKMYKLSEEECGRLRAQFKCQEDDREYLIRQVVNLKKENKRLTIELAAMAQEAQQAAQERDDVMAQQAFDTRQGPALPAQIAATMSLAGVDKDAVQVKVQRYEDVIESLKRLLEAERRRTKAARAAHTAELQQRTELQTLLRQCVEDVRERRRNLEAELGPAAAGAAAGSPAAATASGAFGKGLGVKAARPASALPGSRSSFTGSGGGGGAAGSRPSSAVGSRTGFSNFGSGSSRRPFSAVARMQQRPTSAAAIAGVMAGSGVSGLQLPGDAAGMMGADDREELMQELASREELLKALFDRAFPPSAPHPPGDPYIDKLVNMQEERNAQVVANGRALAHMRATGAASKNLPPSIAKDATPGEVVPKEAAGKPWVFNVDAMLSDFLSSKS